MSHIHVCLVSDQPIPNLTSVLQFNPDKIVLLTTKDKESQAKRLEKVIKKRDFEVITRKILPYDINNVINVCESLIAECKNCELTLNITGGTKIGTLGTFQSFFTNSKPIFYVNTKDNEIIQVSPEEKKSPINVSISIKDYLAVYGFNIDRYIKNDDFIFKRKAITECLFSIAMKTPNLIGKINSLLPDNLEKASYPIEITIPDDASIIKLSGMLVTAGLAYGKNRRTLQLPDYDIAKYLKGIWLEEYVYMTAKSFPECEIRLGVEGQWDATGKFPPRNEFDVLITKGNRLFYISCKTANPDRKEKEYDVESISKDYLYELDSIGDDALGLFGKRMLISARPITNDYVRKRAEVLKIDMIDGKNLITLKENLKQWLNS